MNLCEAKYNQLVPVELTSFTASVIDRDVTLNWSTGSEINNLGFEIQRKSATDDFVPVAFIEGHGTTQQPQSYSYTDKVEAGKYSYRLKQVDFNGIFSYSDPIEVNARIPAKFGLSQNYPNPFNPTTKIEYSIPEESFVNLKIYNLIGQEVATLVNQHQKAGTYRADFNAGGLYSGIYIAKLNAGGISKSIKMTLLK
jgi:hypothetical protein